MYTVKTLSVGLAGLALAFSVFTAEGEPPTVTVDGLHLALDETRTVVTP